ncbi:MAG: hypothetical protein LUC94_01020 [Clostridiales bacterium]|nr:hypothetical protein [Clostridiales bacterium]
MGKAKTDSFVVTRRIYTTPDQADIINDKMDLGNRIYNNGVKYCIPLVKELHEDIWFQQMLAAWKNCTDEEERKIFSEELNLCIQAYGVTEYAIHAYLGKGKQMSYDRGHGINIVQKLGTALYQSVRKAVFAGTQIHFRKYGQTDTLEDKKANSGIIYKPEIDTVSFAGLSLKLKPIRRKDNYLMEAMTRKVKYCRIVRKPYKAGYHYFLQIVMEGAAPEKLVLGKDDGGLDPGVSTMSVVTESGAKFMALAEGVEKYERAVRDASIVYERRRRMANPENYNPPGHEDLP